MKKFLAVFGFVALAGLLVVSLGTNFSTPLGAEEECWCCYQGKVFPSTYERCKEMGGICFPTKEEAVKNCQEQPEPACWCCYKGMVSMTTPEKCKELGGICYPTKEEAVKNCREGGRLPDLVIDNIEVNRSCQVVVTAKNLGPGLVPDTVWTVHTPTSCGVYLYINGKKWGGGTIWGFDPARALQTPGGTATYTSKLKVTGIATITAIIDHTHQVTEANETNNKMTKRLKCR
jgi:hypothetical protein